jgi:hypothetical protein
VQSRSLFTILRRALIAVKAELQRMGREGKQKKLPDKATCMERGGEAAEGKSERDQHAFSFLMGATARLPQSRPTPVFVYCI